jgi:hypothetical protein|tara:strand:+ start:14274 stop:15596 length:1323 start_codon:yes stop_codon:yes gene_type:complete
VETQAVNIKLFPKQLKALKVLEDSTTTELLYGGGAGSGKSALGCLWQIFRRLQYAGTRSVIGRSVLKNLKATTLNTFFEMSELVGLEPNVDFRYNGQDSTITFTNGSIIYLKDLFKQPSDPEFTSLGGLEITDAFIDESAEVTEKAVDILKSRIRYKLTENNLIPKILLTCNPSKGWLYTKYYRPDVEGKLPDYMKFIKALATDNKYLSPHYISQLEKLDPLTKSRLLYGNWEYADDDALLFNYNALGDLFTNTFIEGGTKYISVDVARLGSDKSIICVWNGKRLEHIVKLDKNTITQLAQRIKTLANEHRVPFSKIVIDADGVGGGVVDMLSGCVSFVNGSKALKGQNYQNLKTQCYYKFSEDVNNGRVYITNTKYRKEIIEELEVVKRDKVDKDTQKLAIESKDIVKSKLGRSPDFADAIIMRWWYEAKGNYGDYAII